MSSANLAPRPARFGVRRRFVLGAVGAAAAAFAVFVPPSASALAGSTFEGGDGNLVHTGTNTDWDNVAGRNTGVDLSSAGSIDNAFGQGTKEDNAAVSVVTGGIPPNKNDLSRFYEASSLGANGHTYLDLAWERLVNIGNANLDFEINQAVTANFSGTTTGAVTLNRTAGDLLVTYDFGGSGTPTLGLNTWLTAAAGNTIAQCFSANALPCWGKNVMLTGANSEGAVNTVSVIDPAQSGSPTLGVGLFGEAAIDLTAANVFPPGTCEAFGSTFVKSRSSSSFTAELKDFIAPVPVNISNCGSITVHKVTENGDATFNYTATGGLSPASFTMHNGSTQTFGSSVQAGSYSISEGTLPAGWTLRDVSCGTVAGSGTSATISGATISVTMAPGGTVDCTYTNHTKVSPAIATTLSASSTGIGTAVHDSSTLSGATADAGGTVIYHAYAGANTCSGTDLLNSTKTVTNGVVPDSADVSFAAAGTYSFQAVYSGDSNNNTATSVCSTEQLVVNKNGPTISTTLSTSTTSIGTSVHDSSALTGATATAGGTVTYHAYAGANTCSGTDLLNSTKTVTNGVVPDSADVSFAAAGTYSFQAVYSGDSNNNTATSVCSTEQLVVGKNSPTITTLLSSATGSIGDMVNDSSALSGATSSAGGTVTYTMYTNSGCTTGPRDAGTVTVTNGIVPASNGLVFNSAGTFYWQAVYSGDANNKTATSVCTDEQLVIGKNSPSASTAQHVIPNDSFTLSGASSGAGGTITFNLYAPSAPTCSGTPALTQTVSVSGNGTYNTTNTLFVASTEGTWRWASSYSGDGNNNGAVSTCGTERFTIANT